MHMLAQGPVFRIIVKHEVMALMKNRRILEADM